MTKPVVLAFSGGLDTSFLIPYLKETLKAPIVAVHVNTGGLTADKLNELSPRARELGARDARVVDAREQYYREVISYLIKGNVLRGEVYPLCVGAERVTQAKELVKAAREIGAGAIAHGSTAAGNDQVRFEIYLRVLAPEIEILAPVRDEGFKREAEADYLTARGFPFSKDKARFSINKGLWGTTIGARDFQDSSKAIPEEAYQTVTTETPETVQIGFEKGLPVSLNGKAMAPVALIEELNDRAGALGIGRGVHMGNTALGIKGRIAFEAPAASVLLPAHRELEKLVLTKWETFWKRELSQFYGDQLHEGHYFDPVLREIEAFMDRSQERVTGSVSVRLEKFQARVESLSSPYSMADSKIGVYGEEALSWTGAEAKGFAKIGAIPAQLWHRAGAKS
jgi:argininosuccinate synthase